MGRILLLLFLSACVTSTAQSGELYERFLSLIDTNKAGPLAVTSPLLTDTNNTAPKLTNSAVNLSEAYMRGEIGGVRLGMTMEQVAAFWGKPRYLWGRCYGGPRFCYSDVSVIFDPNSNSVMRVMPFPLPRLYGGLDRSSTLEQFETVLGKPFAREELPKYGIQYLTYASPRSSLRVEFSEGRLQWFRLEQPSDKYDAKEETK